jgi:hypothetical protein
MLRSKCVKDLGTVRRLDKKLKIKDKSENKEKGVVLWCYDVRVLWCFQGSQSQRHNNITT